MVSRRRITQAVSVGVLLLAGCGGGSSIAEPEELPTRRVQAVFAQPWPEATYVIRTDAEWQAAWAGYASGLTPPPQRPAVNFAQDMLLGLSRGWGPDGCHSVRIKRVYEEATRVRVEFQHQRGLTGVGCTLALVPLSDFVAVPRLGKAVVFVEVAA